MTKAAGDRAPRWTGRRVAALVVVALLLVLGWTTYQCLRARADLLDARRRLEDLRAEKDVGVPAARRALDEARRDVLRAQRRTDGALTRVVGRVPYAGRNVVALDTAGNAALAVVEATRDVLDDVGGADATFFSGQRVDLARLARLRATLLAAQARVEPSVRRLAALRVGLTAPTVAGSVRAAERELTEARDRFADGAALVDAVSSMAGARGERRWLVVLQNNAELRGTGGLISVFAEVTARNGELRVGAFRDIADIDDSPPAVRRVPAPADYEARYGRYLAATTLWKNVNMTPDAPTASAVIARLAGVSLGRAPSAVVMLDVPAIAAVLEATGPARLADGRELTGSNAVEELLVRAYRGVPDTQAGQDERRRRLRVAADGVLATLLAGGSDPAPLFGELAAAMSGRHLTLWSADPAEQRAFDAVAAAGSVPAADPDIAMVTLQNLGGGAGEGNKLDYYAVRRHQIGVVVDRDAALTTHTFSLRNDAPASGLPRYVAGVERPGESRNLIAFAVPKNAELEQFDQDDRAAQFADEPEGDYRSLVVVAVLQPGQQVTWKLRYRVPLASGRYGIRLVPQPLARDAQLTLDVRAADDVRLSDVRGGKLAFTERWGREHHITADVGQHGWWKRLRHGVRDFWDEPVHLG